MLEFSVVNQKLTRIDMFYSVRDSKDYLTASFDFRTDDWAGMTKTAVFNMGDKDGSTYTVLMDGNTVKLPEVCLKSSFVNISVFGVADGVRITTNVVKVELKNSGYAEGETPPEPSETVYENILAKCEKAVEAANSVQERADSGEFTGEKGEKGDKGDKGDTGETGATGPQGPPGKDAVTETELSVESNNAIANSTVAKVLGNGTLIGFEKVDSLEDFEELSSRYPKGIPENAFLILYVTQDLSYTDPNTQFTFPPGLYLLTQQGEIRLCPDTESVNAQFNAVNNLIKDWGVVFASKADKSELNLVKLNLDDVSDTADEALTIAKGRNRALTFLTYQELSSWIDGDFTRSDGKTVSDLQTGDNLYIVETGVPDYWWDGTQIRPLETQKVDLSEYAEKDYVDEEIAEQVAVPNSDIANYLEVTDILGIWKNATAGRTSFQSLFENSAVKVVPLLDTSDGTNFSSMFKGCGQLESVPLFDTSKATTFLNMFYGCESLKSIPAFNTAKLTNSFGMMRECTSLLEFKGIDISKVTNCNGMFYGCTSIEEIEIDTSSVINGNYLFYRCSSLKTVKTLDFSNIASLSRQFYQCTSLESVEFVPESIKLSMSMADCSKLGSDSVASIFAGLADLTDSDAQTLTLHKDVQITQAQADGAVAKNWNIVGGTVNG